MDQIKIGKFIQLLRKTSGLTQHELAERLNVSNQTVSRWERGIAFPDHSVLPEISSLFNTSIDEIYNGERSQINRPTNRSLICRIHYTSADDLVDKRLRTKYSDSEYGIEFINLGSTPLLLDSFDIVSEEKTLVGACCISENERRLDPYCSLVYTFSMQDADALLFHCHKDTLNSCTVCLFSVDGSEIDLVLDTSSLVLSMFVSDIDDCIID